MHNSASIQPRTGLSKFAKNSPNVRKKVRKNIGLYSSTAQQVRELFSDLKLAVEENEPGFAVELLTLSKEWVEEMKSKGSAVRERYEELTTEFASVLN